MLSKYIDLGAISLVESFASAQHIKGQKQKEIAPGAGRVFFTSLARVSQSSLIRQFPPKNIV